MNKYVAKLNSKQLIVSSKACADSYIIIKSFIEKYHNDVLNLMRSLENILKILFESELTVTFDM